MRACFGIKKRAGGSLEELEADGDEEGWGVCDGWDDFDEAVAMRVRQLV